MASKQPKSKNPGLNVQLTADLDRFIRERIARGEFESPDDVVRAGLRSLMRSARTERADMLEEVRRKIALGLRQARSGHLLDGEAVFEELRQLLPRRRTPRK